MSFKSVRSPSAPLSSPQSSLTPAGNDSPLEIFNSLASGGPQEPQSLEAGNSNPGKPSTPPSAPAKKEEVKDDDAQSQLPQEGSGDQPEGESAFEEIEVSGDGKPVRFKLDKNDKKLKDTLAWGVAGPRLAKKAKELKLQLSEIKTNADNWKVSHSKFEDAVDLANQGYYESALKQIFGEEAYKKMYNDLVLQRIDYDMAAPEEKLEIDRRRMERAFAEKEYLFNKRQGKTETASKEDSAKQQTEVMSNMGLAAASKFTFDDVESDGTAKELLRNKLWTLAFNDVEEWVEAKGGKITPPKSVIEKAFAHNYRLLTGARKAAKHNDVAKSAASKDNATKDAKAAASENYSRPKGEEDFKAMNPLDIFKTLGGRLI